MTPSIDWSKAKFLIAAPSGNVAVARSQTNNTGQVAIQANWQTTPTNDDIEFFNGVIRTLLPNSVNDVVSARNSSQAESDRQVKAFLMAPNN